MRLGLLSATLTMILLCGCATRPGLKVIALKDAERATWAEPIASSQPSDPLLAYIHGYGGRKVTVELWREPGMLVQKRSYAILASKTYRSEDGWVWDTRFKSGPIEPAEQWSFYRTSSDRFLRIPALDPGVYELRLSADDGRKESAKFTVRGYP